MKKILSFILALLMVVSCASLVFAAEEPAAIADEGATVTKAGTDGQFDFAIKFLEQYGIYKGTSATEFVADAESEIQRYQMALFVARISTGWVDDSKWAVYDEWNDGPENRNENRSAFDDLAGTYAEKVYGAISYAAQKGIIEGYGNNKFGPTDGITYQNALTMVVRTLGYKNLPWPWGYIEKAVTLGLTEGIPSTIAYTDVLNRGAVAQIIYNALFAETKEGDTLAARNFNGGLGWATIIITVCGKNQRGQYFAYDPDNKDEYNKYHPEYTGVGSGDPNKTENQLIGFNVVKADGTLDEKTYWVKNGESFNLPAHPERFLGHAYSALFTQDGDSQFVNMLYFKPLLIDDDNDNYTVWNYGRLQKNADGEYPIYAYLKGYTLVSKFNQDSYLNKWNSSYGYGEYIVKHGLQAGAITVTTPTHKYGINWITGDIVEKTTEDKADYTVVDTDGTKLYFKTIWKYNDKLGLYFKYVYNKVGETTELVGIDVLGEDDIKTLIDTNFLTEAKAVGLGFANWKDTVKDYWKTAYASLKSFSLNDYGTPDYGIFEEYRLGQYTTSTDVKCPNDDKVGGFVITAVDALKEETWKKTDDLLDPAIDYQSKNDFPTLKVIKDLHDKSISGTIEGTCSHADCWFSEEGLQQADLKENDFIIYSFDKPTGELKVVKKIYDISDPKHTDTDFVATGIVRAYNIPAKVVTIGDTQYSFDYPELLGNGLNLKDGDDTWLARASYTYLFKSLFNQYVKYVICDDRLVYIELAGKSGELIVVDSYAGLSSDGYIVVNGYKTDDLVYSQFRIGSYNGWVKGDYFYYPSNAEVDKAFYRGTIYQIQSYDKSENVYFVNTVALKSKIRAFDGVSANLRGNLDGYTYSMSFMDYDYDELIEKGIIEADKSGYYIPQPGYKQKLDKNGKPAEASASSASDKYVLICNPIWNGYYRTQGNDDATEYAHDLNGVDYTYPGAVAGGDYAPIIVYTGKGDVDWTFFGYKVKGTSANVYINVNFEDIVGFDRDQYDISYVLFLTYDYETARYDSANAGDNWYLLGASTYTARVFDFYTGLVETRIATNKDLKKGYSYPAINGVIVNDTPYDAARLNVSIPGAYLSGRQFKFGHDVLGTKYVDLWDKKEVSKKILSGLYGFDKFQVEDLTTGTRVFLVTAEAATLNGFATTKITEVNQVDKDQFKAWIEANHLDTATMYYWYIHTVHGETVFYIEKSGNKVTTVPYELATSNLLDVSNDTPDHAYIDGILSGTATYVEDADGNKGLVSATIDTLKFSFVGPATKGEHEAIDTNDYHFGHPGYCTQEDWETIITINDVNYRIYGTIFEEEYDPQEYDKTHCALIKTVKIDLSKAVIVNLDETVDDLSDDFKDTAAFKLPILKAGAVVSPITVTTTYKDSNGTVYTFIIDITVTAEGTIASYKVYDISAEFTADSTIDTEGAKDYSKNYLIDGTLDDVVIELTEDVVIDKEDAVKPF